MEDISHTKESSSAKLTIINASRHIKQTFLIIYNFLKKNITNEFVTTIKCVYICPKCDQFLKNDGHWKLPNASFLDEITAWRTKKIKRTKNGLIFTEKICPECNLDIIFNNKLIIDEQGSI